MEKKLMLIVNPAAGRGGYKVNFAEALHTLDLGGYRTTLFFTSGRGEATEFAARHAGAFDTVACIGGDGTLSEVLAGLMQLDSPPPVGYMPMGTANDDKYFAYIAAFGAFTEVSYATPQDQKKRLGHLAYVLQGAQQLGKIESYKTRVEYDGGVVEADLLYGSMSNSTSVAGIVRLPSEMVCLGDGMSELVLVKNPGSVAGFGEIVESVLSQRFDSENLLILHTRQARFIFDKPVSWTRDGEAGGEYQDITLKNYECPVQMIF